MRGRSLTRLIEARNHFFLTRITDYEEWYRPVSEGQRRMRRTPYGKAYVRT